MKHVPTITICRRTLSVRVPVSWCGCAGETPANLRMWLRRYGDLHHTANYPVFDTLPDGSMDFRLDKALLGAASGLYEVIMAPDQASALEVGARVSANLMLKDDTPQWGRTQRVDLDCSETGACVAPPPEGISDMFDHLTSFCGVITAELSDTDTTIPMSSAHQAVLCNTPICRPVQLELWDGVNNEIVTFSACSAGTVVVQRGTPRFKFPKGSHLRFRWTQDNVTNASAGCP